MSPAAAAERSLSIVHVITGLEVGGAETALARLLGAMDRDRFANRVISITRDGPVGAIIRDLGIEVDVVSLKPNLFNWFGLARRLRALAPDLVQTWLYQADVLGGLAARRAGAPRVVWGVRHSNLDRDSNERSVLLFARWAAHLSRRVPDRILFNSQAARETHVGIGYDATRSEVVPNGFDVERFRPDPAARRAIREELGLDGDDGPLVGLVARFHPQKDHATFFAAARRVAERVPGVRFVLCGRGVGADNGMLRRWVHANGLDGRVHLLGLRDDMPAVQAALDLAVSSSVGEAFPNAIGEAMACGVPCVATDVGDSALLVGGTGRVVRPRDGAALADACVALLDGGADARQELGRAARRRIVDHFSLPAITRRYEAIYSGSA